MCTKDAVIRHLHQLLKDSDLGSTTEDSLQGTLSSHFKQNVVEFNVDIKVGCLIPMHVYATRTPAMVHCRLFSTVPPELSQ